MNQTETAILRDRERIQSERDELRRENELLAARIREVLLYANETRWTDAERLKAIRDHLQ